MGYDEIPSIVYKNEILAQYLHVLFNFCYNAGKVPKTWGKCITSCETEPAIS
jgi:hypothetical protein